MDVVCVCVGMVCVYGGCVGVVCMCVVCVCVCVGVVCVCGVCVCMYPDICIKMSIPVTVIIKVRTEYFNSVVSPLLWYCTSKPLQILLTVRSATRAPSAQFAGPRLINTALMHCWREKSVYVIERPSELAKLSAIASVTDE